jgi:Carboxypeptidase regulatory-like domain
MRLPNRDREGVGAFCVTEPRPRGSDTTTAATSRFVVSLPAGRASVFAILLAAVLMAQEPAPPPRPSVAGMVVSTAGDPVRKARVLLKAQDEAAISYTVDSDGNGRFLIEDVQPGTYAVSADRQGFMLEADGAPGAPPPSVKVEAGQSLNDVKIKLVPLGVITGRVLDDDGDPVRGAQVQAMAYTYQGGSRQLRNVEQVAANEKGEFRLFGLRPGTFYIRASARDRGRPMHTSSIVTGIPSGSLTATYFPSTTESVHASPVELSAGAQLRGFDIRLRREMHYSVRGKLPEGLKPETNFMVRIVPRGGAREGGLGFGSSMRRDDETFEFMDVAPGSYVIVGTVLNQETRSVVRQPVEVGSADVEGVILSFVAPISISGVVRVEGTPSRPMENLRVSLQSDIPSMLGQSSAEVKPDGSFVIPEAAPDVYQVNVGSHAGTYVKSIRFGDEEAPDGRVDLTKGSGPVTVLLATDVGTVDGSVKKSNGDPAVRIRITLIAYGNHLSRTDLSRSGFTDEQGKFHLRNVAPGEYKVFAWEDVPVGAPQDPEFRKPFEKQAATLKMESNGHETVELTAISVKAAQRTPQ